jgi:hypothetical protein
MAKTLQSRVQGVKLMELNRRDIIKALNDVGITDAKEDTPFAELAGLIKWATGFGSCDLAVYNKDEGKYEHFTKEEWDAKSANERSAYISLGILFRAEAKQWIIARSNATNSSNAAAYTWANEHVNVPTLKDYNVKSTGFLTDFDGKGKTDKICAYAATATNKSYPAAQICRAYKAAEGDPTEWYLPDVSEWKLMNRYRSKINAALVQFFGVGLTNDRYWTSDEYNVNFAWFSEAYGGVYYYYKATVFT